MKRRDKERRMHDIVAFDSTGHRHDAYRRELERLACECEDLLGLLDEAKPDGVAWAAKKIREALDRVHSLGAPDHRRERAKP